MVFLGADHRGYELKEKIKKYLDEKEVDYKDYGTNSSELVNYPIIAKEVCLNMNVREDKAILICGSGIGMSVAANKFKGIRAGICLNEEAARDGKQHSNLNVLVLAGDVMSYEESVKIIDIWLESEFLNGRYLERIKMIEEIEKENMK